MCKICKQIFRKLDATIYKKHYTLWDKWSLSKECGGWFNIWKKKINVIQHIKKLKKKKIETMIISIDRRKHVMKSGVHSWFFFFKIPQQSSNRGNFLHLIKGIYEKPTAANITPNIERLNAFSLRSEVSQEGHLSPFLFNITLEVSANKSRKINKRHSG